MKAAKPLQLLRLSFWSIIVYLAVFQAWSGRFQPFVTDSISYLDMADYIRHGQFNQAVSSYWSPAYPAVVAFFLYIINPAPGNLFAVMKIANVAIFVCTAIVFEWLLKEVYIAYREELAKDPRSLSQKSKRFGMP